MSVAQEIAKGRAALLDLGRALGVGLDPLRNGENADRLTTGPVTVSPNRKRWDRIDQARLDGWFLQLGEALEVIRCELRSQPGGPRRMTWAAKPGSHDRSALEPLLDEARRYGSDVDVTVEVGKGPLEEALGRALAAAGMVRLAEVRIAFFFFGASLARILAQPGAHYRFFEQHFLQASGPAAPDRLLLILVANARGRVRGHYLAVFGKDRLGEAGAFPAAARPLEHLQEARRLMNAECLWDQRAWLLTPDFFTLTEAEGGLAASAGELRRLQNELALPYLANWTLGAPGELVVKFEGNRAVRISAEKTATAPFDLYAWAYRQPQPLRARLEIVRRVVAARLPPETIALDKLIANAPELLSECDVQLRLLTDENLADSFERRERIEKLVRDYVDEVGRDIQSLTKEAVDNAYKTVGLLVGIALAYLLKPDGGTTIVVVGVLLYIAYIAFILRFYLRSLEQEHEAKRLAFDGHKQDLARSQVLTNESRARLESVTSQDTKLRGTLRTVRRIYGSLIAAALVLLLGWFGFRAWRETPEVERRRALAEQADRFKGFGYQDVRADAGGWPAPDPLADGGGKAVVPDLTAIRKSDRRFLVVSWVPCEKIGNSAALEEIQALQGIAELREAELQVLTEAVCRDETGPERVREWLEGKPPVKIWTW